LALHRLRRRLERFAPADAAKRRPVMEVRATKIVGELRELIDALDRRVPHLERAGEGAIAHEAAVLKLEALRRIAALEGQDTHSRSALDVGAGTVDGN
jgi:hypothetical protein